MAGDDLMERSRVPFDRRGAGGSGRGPADRRPPGRGPDERGRSGGNAAIRTVLAAAILIALASPVFLAEPQKIGAPGPGKPAKLSVPGFLGAPPTADIAVTPSTEPWYTIFGTGEVVGFIE